MYLGIIGDLMTNSSDSGIVGLYKVASCKHFVGFRIWGCKSYEICRRRYHKP